MTATRRIGEYEVFILLDGTYETSVDKLVHLGGTAARQRAVDALGQSTIRVDVNCFLLRGPSGTILVDAACGSAWGPEFGKARRILAELGIAADQVDRVLMTHLHSDHVLGLYDGQHPYFTRAEVHVSRPELSFFTDPNAREALPKTKQGTFDLVAAVQDAYGDRLKIFDHGPVMPGIEALALPGHTPGHTGFLLKDAKQSLLIWGDTVHLAGVQAADPEFGMIYDMDPAEAAATRRSTFAEAAREGWIVAGCHIGGFNRVEESADGHRIVEA